MNRRGGKIILKDFVENSKLHQYFSAADICVWGDTITVSMLEAMSCGRPIVGCDVPEFQERIQYGNGLSFKKGDENDLFNQLEKLIKSEKLRLQMGQKGRKLIEDNYSWEKVSEQFLLL